LVEPGTLKVVAEVAVTMLPSLMVMAAVPMPGVTETVATQ